MRIAIFSDVHGNLTALQAVLAHIGQQEGIDEVIFAGDLCVFGPRPRACLELIRERNIASITGNTDQWLQVPPPLPANATEVQRRRWEYVQAISTWTGSQLDADDLAWFNELSLPFQRRISPTPNPRDDLFIVHANPQDVNQIIFPAEARQKELYGQVRQSDSELRQLLGDLVVGVLAFGHLHVPGVRHWQGITLVNVSSVSMPGDGDPRAKYAVLSWEDGPGWSVEHFTVDYPVAEEIKAFQDMQPPGWEESVRKLKELGMIPQVV
ncbi:MAG: metallophosphatase family protein [Chloroflexi bacterium]|nr:metallophosphatase family protein [Chloroflexota bacterium]MCI0578662.1 metallophosphatase family protein [Chloroflexota bacterium]MCI0647235.1 metallophosphatase family protein [Chloroflexota bacterium]MCI0728961.1 metallophosphatase family protein [Chloroflexota bacterium]